MVQSNVQISEGVESIFSANQQTLVLALLQHAPEFNSRQRGMRRLERFESEHGSNNSLDEPVILLHDVIKIFALANLDAFVFINVELFDSRGIGLAFNASTDGRN